MATLNVYESLLRMLNGISQRQIFGVFGDAINPLADALRKDKEERFEWITVRHEEVGAFAAAAQAKLTGKLGVCAGTVGPGAIHLLNGLYDAQMDHAPVLAITGQVPRDEIGSHFHQEVNLDRLFDDVCVYNQTVISPGQMPRLGLFAIQKALAANGVAHISVPSDVGPSQVKHIEMRHPVFQSNAEMTPCPSDLQQLATDLNKGKKITLFIGWGSRGATEEIIALAEKLKAPVVHSLKGKAVLPHAHPHWAGGTGLLGTTCGVHALDQCDTLLMLGTDFPYRQFIPDGKKIYQIDKQVEFLGRRCGIELGLVGHIKSTVKALLPLLDVKTDEKHLKNIQKERAKWDQYTQKKALNRGDKPPIHPQAVGHAINEFANDEAVFTADTGETIIWMARQVHMQGDRDFIASFNHASMANAMPQAIGIQALDRSRQVVAMCGDGGFSMLMSDFITAVTYKLPIKVIVFNNSVLGLVKMEMEASGYPEWGVKLDNPNFADCAKAMGGEGIRVDNPSDVRSAIKRAMEIDGPVVVDVATNRNEVAMPPKIEAAKAWGYSISKLKELVMEVEK